jgi:hypothetical protein
MEIPDPIHKIGDEVFLYRHPATGICEVISSQAVTHIPGSTTYNYFIRTPLFTSMWARGAELLSIDELKEARDEVEDDLRFLKPYKVGRKVFEDLLAEYNQLIEGSDVGTPIDFMPEAG